MAKIVVCDICKKEGKLTETTKYMSVKGQRHLKLDFCDDCRSKIPKNMDEYKKFVMELL